MPSLRRNRSRSPRSQQTRARAALAVAALFVALVLLGVGVSVGHLSDPPTGPGGPPPQAGVPSSGAAAHSRPGAVQVAIDHLEALNGADWYDTAARDELLGRIAAPAARDKLVLVYDQAARAIEQTTGLVSAATSGAPLISPWAPLGYRVDRYTGAYAAVTVWGVSVTGTVGGAPPQAAWATTTVTEQWSAGRGWELADLDTVTGPVPVAPDADPTDPADMVPAVLDLEAVAHGPRL